MVQFSSSSFSQDFLKCYYASLSIIQPLDNLTNTGKLSIAISCDQLRGGSQDSDKPVPFKCLYFSRRFMLHFLMHTFVHVLQSKSHSL